jgi:hypothetical protein
MDLTPFPGPRLAATFMKHSVKTESYRLLAVIDPVGTKYVSPLLRHRERTMDCHRAGRRAGRMQMLTEKRLRQENLAFVGTSGVSADAASQRFRPAFRDPETGRVELSRFEDGRPAPVHVIFGLPAEWVIERDADGHVVAVKEQIQSGFVRGGAFFTREEAAELVRR